MHTTVYTKRPKFLRADMYTDLQMLLLDVSYLTLLMQRLGQQSTYCNSFSTVLSCFKH